jgi:hypothetical protein
MTVPVEENDVVLGRLIKDITDKVQCEFEHPVVRSMAQLRRSSRWYDVDVSKADVSLTFRCMIDNYVALILPPSTEHDTKKSAEAPSQEYEYTPEQRVWFSERLRKMIGIIRRHCAESVTCNKSLRRALSAVANNSPNPNPLSSRKRRKGVRVRSAGKAGGHTLVNETICSTSTYQSRLKSYASFLFWLGTCFIQAVSLLAVGAFLLSSDSRTYEDVSLEHDMNDCFIREDVAFPASASAPEEPVRSSTESPTLAKKFVHSFAEHVISLCRG